MKPPGIAAVLEMAKHGPLLEEMNIPAKRQSGSRSRYTCYPAADDCYVPILDLFRFVN
jgi:hypothetical protein